MNILITKKRSATLFALLIILTLLIFASGAVPARAATDGHISGQLRDGSNQNAPVADQKVTLQMAQGTTAKDLATVTTDAQGNFSFDRLDTAKTISYAVYLRYLGAQYVSNLVTLDSNPAPQVNLTVYQVTQSPANIAIRTATVLMKEPDVAKGTITISEAFSFENLATRTYVGSLDASKGKPNALLFSLPVKASAITLGQGFSGYQLLQVDRGFATDAALLPGHNDFSFSFDVPYSSTNYDMLYTTLYPTASLSLLAPTDVHVTTDVLSAQGTVSGPDDQHPYSLFKATALSAHKDVQVRLDGLLARPTTNASAALNPNLFWMLVTLAIMFVAVLILWYFQRVRSRQVVVPAKVGTANKQAARSKLTASEEPQQALLQELLVLDKDYEAGKLSKAIYQEQRSKTKARLRTLLSEQESARR